MDATHFMAIESSPISTWGVPQMGDPQHGWFTMEIPLNIKWMIQGHLKGHLRKPPHIDICPLSDGLFNFKKIQIQVAYALQGVDIFWGHTSQGSVRWWTFEDF